MKVITLGGKSWEIRINVATVKRVRAMLNVDLPGLIEDRCKGLFELIADPVKLVDVLYVLCRDQAEKAEVSDVAFAESISGDTLEAAGHAFINELVDFFPNAGTRTALHKLMEAGRKIEKQVMSKAQHEIERLDIDLLANKLTSEYGKSPALSASAPNHSPSEN